MPRKKSTAVAYYRTSSASNVGADKDSQRRQAEAVESYAKGRHDIATSFYDAAVSGADPVDARAGFAELLAYCEAHQVCVVLVENASRFARDLAVQLTGHALLRARGIELIPVDAPTYFTDPSPTAELVRQILGAVSQFEKAPLLPSFGTPGSRCEQIRAAVKDASQCLTQLLLRLAGWPGSHQRPAGDAACEVLLLNWQRSVTVALQAGLTMPAASATCSGRKSRTLATVATLATLQVVQCVVPGVSSSLGIACRADMVARRAARCSPLGSAVVTTSTD